MKTATKKRTAKDIFFVAASNLISILASLLTGFIIPKILGVQEYGYFKTFTLYAGYIGLFHFGFCDGIQLIFAGKRQDELIEKDFLAYTRFLIVMESIVSCIGLLVALIFLEGNYKFIFACVAVDLILQNVMCYYQYILQCTQQFKEYAIKNVVNSILTSLGVVGLWIVYKFGDASFVNFKTYVIILLSIYFVLTIWFVIRFRKLTFGKSTPFKEAWPLIWKCFRLGFPLLIANLCSGLILSFDSQFVNVLFPNEVYAVYAFAYSVLGMVTRLISAVTIVIYPILKKTEPSKLANIFPRIVTILIIFTSASLVMYYPLVPIINWILPQYMDSLIIFRIILPGLMLSSVVSVIIQNYYKAVSKPGLFFIFSAITLAVSIGLNFAAYYIFGTTASISWASIITLGFYYILTLIPLIVTMKVKWVKNTLYLSSMITAFYLCFLIEKTWISFVVYFTAWIAMTFLFFFSIIKIEATKIIGKFKHKPTLSDAQEPAEDITLNATDTDNSEENKCLDNTQNQQS